MATPVEIMAPHAWEFLFAPLGPRAPDWISEYGVRFPLAGHRVGDGLDGVEATDDERKRVDCSTGLILPELKVDVWNSQGPADGASLAEHLAALDFLVQLDVNLVHVAIESPPGDGVAHRVPDCYTSIMFSRTCDHTIGGSNHWISLGGVYVDTAMAPPYTRIAVIPQDPRGALSRAPGEHDHIEHRDCEQSESPSDDPPHGHLGERWLAGV
jgi:hypothetical protein